MNDTSHQGDIDRPAADAKAEEPTTQPTPLLRAAWVVCAETLETLDRTLGPLSGGLIDELIELLVICPGEADVRGLPVPPVEVLRHDRLRWLIFENRWIESLVERVKLRKVQVLHALDGGAAGLVRKLAHSTSLPYIVSSCDLRDVRRLGPLDDSAAVLAASEPVRRGLLHHHAAPAEKIRLMRPGLYHVRQTTCFDDERRKVAIIAGGSLKQSAPFEAVLKSFAEVSQRDANCVFFLIGSGRAEKRLRQLAERLHLRQELTFVDRMPSREMPGIFKAADMFISPVAAPGLDTWLLMAMAAGVPVLATMDSPCDFLIDGRTAMLFRQGEAAQLTAKLMALLDDKPAARGLAKSALAYVKEHHSLAEMVATLAQIYRDAVV